MFKIDDIELLKIAAEKAKYTIRINEFGTFFKDNKIWDPYHKNNDAFDLLLDCDGLFLNYEYEFYKYNKVTGKPIVRKWVYSGKYWDPYTSLWYPLSVEYGVECGRTKQEACRRAIVLAAAKNGCSL